MDISITIYFKTACLLAWTMLAHNISRLFFTILGVGTAFFLAAAQFGILIGWIYTTTALINHAQVDLWIMAKHTPTFEYGAPIPKKTVYLARSAPGVKWAQTMFVSWSSWVRPNGSSISTQLIGLDYDEVGGPWSMYEGEVKSIQRPETVLMDELYRNVLGIEALGDSGQLNGLTAHVGGFSEGVRAFTGIPHLFTSVKQALAYDLRYLDDEITYVLVRTEKGVDVELLQQDLQTRISGTEVLTSKAFATLTAKYWMLKTGAGIGVVITAILGLLVGAIVTSQTLFSTTQENRCNYVSLLVIGFERKLLTLVVFIQSLIVSLAGIFVGGMGYMVLHWSTTRSPLSFAFDPIYFIALTGVFILISILAAGLSMRSVFKIDPIEVFSQQ